MGIRIAAIIVTHNRLELLKENINALRTQNYKLSEIVVVNNSSTDGTLMWLNNQKDLTIINQPNYGSSGGQYIGIKYCYEKGYDWIWTLDCDVIPNDTSLKNLVSSLPFSSKDTGYLSSIILDENNQISHINLPYLGNSQEIVTSFHEYKELSVKSASFGSLLLNSKCIEKIGFPKRDFFIWGDDVEYTFRIIANNFCGYMITNSIAIHKQPFNVKNPFLKMSTRDKKTFFAVRNTVYTIRLSRRILNQHFFKCLGSLILFFLLIIRKENGRTKRILDVVILTNYFFKGLIFSPKDEFVTYD